MIVRKPLALSLIALAIAAPGLIFASSLYHPAGGEGGFTPHPDHFQSSLSRGDVLESVAVARKDGTLADPLARRCLACQGNGPFQDPRAGATGITEYVSR